MAGERLTDKAARGGGGGPSVRSWLLLATSLGLLSPAPLAAQEELRQGEWTFTLSPYLWAAGVYGHATVRGIKADVDESFGDILDDLTFGAMLFAEARKDRFGVGLNGFFVRTEVNAHVRQLDVDVTSDSASLDAVAFYRVLDWRLGGTAGGGTVSLAIEPLAGARLTYGRAELDANADLPRRSLGRQVDESETWVDPIVGAQAILRLSDRWSLRVEGDVGGFGVASDITWNAQGIIGYRLPGGRFDTILGAGYRALHWDYQNGGFEWDVTQQGPILGAAIRF